MSDLFFFFCLPLSFFLPFFPAVLAAVVVETPWIIMDRQPDIPSVSAVASTLTGPRPTTHGMSGGRTSAFFGPTPPNG